MLGWALNKATGNASNAPPTPGPDDTFVDQPDTPAPVFAARAFKRAIFGTPAPPTKEIPRKETRAAVTKSEKSTFKPTIPETKAYESPSKPPGILLTPGTGTTRRKRVSFGREVKANSTGMGTDTGDGASRTRPRTKLQEALENSRKRRDNRRSNEDDARRLDFDPEINNDEADDVWEEVDDGDREADGTVDLNEPRSQSGRYWKSEFQKYHEEAQAEMEKLVKYKQLAKSYAKAKDAEALDLTGRLKEEQDKVAEMERKITELAGRVGARPGRNGGAQDDNELVKDLTRQTALAVQYRKKVDELEAALKDSGYEAERNKRQRGGPLTAREQAKELSDLRQELQRVKAELFAVEDRERKADMEKRELERKLNRKDTQYDSLKAEYDQLKDKNKALRDEVSSLRRATQPRNGGLLKEDALALSTEIGTSSAWSKKFDELKINLGREQEDRRREMDDASITINRLQKEFQSTADIKPPVQRKSGSDLRAKFNHTPKFDDDTHDLLQHRPLSSIRRTSTPLGRPISRGSKRTMSGRLVDKKSDPIGLASARGTPRKVDTPKTIDLTRLSNKNRLGLVTERALEGELDPEPKSNSVPSTRNVSTRSSLSSDRRAAAIARLEQKRAERKKARERPSLAGKENIRP
ncbi:hypothetical protein N0V93_006548 [Gnomoniopsis smithogilvyi]|uniref:Spindle pole body-associated protein cut12 domain-containing protein n=1 Tax=Gnomoniopsis smithogilvyi TaxID=1191159 RepID=A0A9W8YPV6_9PEZI|nr:hypothetical protein N0V93_006548 [Gnomoniopsis smithogilvyi]